MLILAENITDRLEHWWEQVVMKRAAGIVLVMTYLVALLVIELNRNGILPAPLAAIIPTNHFYAVEVAFTLLLFTEVVSLIFGLTRSFSRSIGIQLEILSLILLRDTFKQFTTFPEPLEWSKVEPSMIPMMADAIGALSIFVILGFYYRIQQQRRNITETEREQEQFVRVKKLIALGLIVTFAAIGLEDLSRWITGRETYPFFETFYTVLIFTDVLMVLVSLHYSNNFAVVFRNFGYAVVTVFIRLALIAPTVLSVLIGIGTALFALSIAYTYKRSGQEIMKHGTDDLEQEHLHEEDERPDQDAPQPAPASGD